MLGRLSALELTADAKEADVIIVNTCGFIHSAKQESVSEILRVSSERKKGAILVVSGCLSERYAKELESDMPEIDIIIGVRDYDKIDSLLEKKGFIFRQNQRIPFADFTQKNLAKKIPQIAQNQNLSQQNSQKITTQKTSNQNLSSTIFSSNDKVFLSDENSKRVISNSAIHAYIKLSEGCNQNCSFCAIPSFKGKLQSRYIASVLSEVENLAKQGYKDFSFIAQDSSSYLLDFGVKDGLISLIKALDSSGAAKTARIHYLYPTTTSHRLIETIAKSAVVQNYFDMPIQHISDKMLRLMKRGMGKSKLKQMLNLMRSIPNAFLRSTIIVGHPYEGEREFCELRDFIDEGIFDRLNLFAFSSEEGTYAHTMSEKIPTNVVNKRLNALNKILKSKDKTYYNALKGSKIPIIIEGRAEVSPHFYSSRDIRWGLEIDGEILINDSQIENLNIGYYEAQITEYKNGLLFGKILDTLR